jgi:4-aminobenzoate N-oxygenase
VTVAVNHKAVERISAAWARRATVRSADLQGLLADDEWDPAVPDYPLRLVPFVEHPSFVEAAPEQRQLVLTLAWCAYNERVITAEDRVANPAFALVQQGAFRGADTPALKDAVQQTLIDEHWHTHLHRVAQRQTVRRRGVDPTGWFPPSLTYRALLAEQASASEPWEADLLTLTWTVVSEISINALLSQLARDETIQPLHRNVTAMHAKDESAHGAVMVEVAKSLWPHLTSQQQDRFALALPIALRAFSSQDLSAWEVIVERAAIDRGADMLVECATGDSSALLVRDYSGLERLAADLDIRGRVDFEFSDPRLHREA